MNPFLNSVHISERNAGNNNDDRFFNEEDLMMEGVMIAIEYDFDLEV